MKPLSLSAIHAPSPPCAMPCYGCCALGLAGKKEPPSGEKGIRLNPGSEALHQRLCTTARPGFAAQAYHASIARGKRAQGKPRSILWLDLRLNAGLHSIVLLGAVLVSFLARV